MAIAARLRGVLHRIQDVLIPGVCAACGVPIACERGPLCLPCWESLSEASSPAYCRRCGEDRQDFLLNEGQCTACLTGWHRTRFHRFIRVGKYRGALKRLVLDFKRRSTLDRLLGGFLADATAGALDPDAIDLWVPIPAHWRRRLVVGYQPTLLLARAAAAAFSGCVVEALRAVRFVKPFHLQPRLSPKRRAEAIRGAFGLRGGIDLHRKTVCLVDDVTTTGATLAEARRILGEAGASQVAAAVIARA